MKMYSRDNMLQTVHKYHNNSLLVLRKIHLKICSMQVDFMKKTNYLVFTI